MAHKVTCLYCGQIFDRDKVSCVLASARRYAHTECAEKHEAQKSKEEKDKENLEKYILKLFNIKSIPPKVNKQIKEYLTKYDYTYTGILKSLIYFFEVKNNDIEKANGGIGIVPYVYNDAKNYYYTIWLAEEKNKNKVVVNNIPTQEIKILRPQRKIIKKKVFSFLDEEEINE